VLEQGYQSRDCWEFVDLMLDEQPDEPLTCLYRVALAWVLASGESDRELIEQWQLVQFGA
jgi:hypothetical protein